MHADNVDLIDNYSEKRSGHLTIYLNPKSKRTVEVATLHELTRALKGAKGYAELEKMALDYYAKHPSEKATIDNVYRALYQDEQLRYEKEVLPDELTAHYIEKMLEKRNVLAQMTVEQPTFMQRCINWLKTRVDKLRSVDTQAADEVDMLARKFVSTFNLNKNKISTAQQLDKTNKMQYAFKGKRVASYINHTLNTPTLSYIRNELYKLYDGVESGIADGFAVEMGNDVYIVDSGKDNGKIDIGVRGKRHISDPIARKEFIRRKNGKAIQQGHISDGLSSKFGNEYDDDWNSYRGRKRGQELSTDNKESQNNQSGISTKNATGGRRGLKKYALTVADSDGKALSAAQQDYFKDSKVRDENGRLLIVYHGTNNKKETTTWDKEKGYFKTKYEKFTVFKKQYDEQVGHFFSADYDNAGGYGSTVYKCYLNITNPLVIDCNNRDYSAITYNGMFKDTYEWAEYAKAEGYDGVIFKNIRDGADYGAMSKSTDQYVVFKSNQIKNADNTNPTENADIRYALKGSDKVMTELPDERVTVKDVLRGRATKAQLATQVKGGLSEQSEAVKVLMTNAQAAKLLLRSTIWKKGKFGINNVLVFAKGSYEDYRITKVVRLKINNETELEKVRDYIYEQETDGYRKSYYQTDDIIGLLYEEEYITRYTVQDCPTYKQIKQSRAKGGSNDANSRIGAVGRRNLDGDSDNGVKCKENYLCK